MPLPVALRQALAIAVNEVLFENLDAIAADPAAFLASGSLGATYQSFVGPTTFSTAQVETWLAQLAPWAPGDGEPWRRLGVAFEAASNDLARAVIHQATGAGEVPAAALPYVDELGKVVAALAQAIASGGYDGDPEELTAID